jgi:hypothetical protein
MVLRAVGHRLHCHNSIHRTKPVLPQNCLLFRCCEQVKKRLGCLGGAPIDPTPDDLHSRSIFHSGIQVINLVKFVLIGSRLVPAV